MKKTLLVSLLAILLMICSAAAEEPHEHDWALQRSGDFHWMRCRVCGEETEKEPHYVLCTDENPTECFFCGMTKGQGAKLDTVAHYVPDEAVDHNELYHWHYCLLCGAIADVGLHESTCLSPETCKICWASVEEGAVIPYTPHEWRLSWDRDGHFEACASCGSHRNYEAHYVYCDSEDKTVCLGCGQQHSDQLFVWFTRHKGERMAYTNESHYLTCDLCGEEWSREPHFSTCAHPEACDTCGAKAAEGAVYTVWHDWDPQTRYDAENHWTVCQVCGATQGLSPHEARCTAPDRCMACPATAAEGATMIVSHMPSTEYGYTEDYHWLMCSFCDEILDEGPHQMEGNVCAVCGWVDRSQYLFQNMRYDGQAVTGVLYHSPEAMDAVEISVRVTFYIQGNYYMATVAEIEPDGSFLVEGVGPIVYITAVASGVERRLDGSTITRTFDAAELFVQ